MKIILALLLIAPLSYGAVIIGGGGEIPPSLVEVSGTGSVDGFYNIITDRSDEGRHRYQSAEAPIHKLQWNAAGDEYWFLQEAGSGEEWTNASQSVLVPPSGWQVGDAASPAPTIKYLAHLPSSLFPAPSTNGTPSADFTGYDSQNFQVTNLAQGGFQSLPAEWTRQAQPGDTITFTGEYLDESLGPGVFIISDSGGNTFEFAPSFLINRECAITLTNLLNTNDMYMGWYSNQNWAGAPFTINQTESWWVGPDTVSTGETFSIYGQNLSLGGGDTYLWCEEDSEWLTNSAGNQYKADFVVPTDWAEEDKTLWAFNGKGRGFGWAEPVTLTVGAKLWNDDTNTWLNVMDVAYGAIGNGTADDRNAINGAIDDAITEGGGTVYLPTGTYGISRFLVVDDSVRLVGDGAASTKIQALSNYTGFALIYAPNRVTAPIAIEDLTFLGNNFLDNNSSAMFLYFKEGVERCSIDGVVFDGSAIDVGQNISPSLSMIWFKESENVSFLNCDFKLPLWVNVKASTQTTFSNCNFYAMHDADYLLNAGGSKEMSIEDCTAQHLDDTTDQEGDGKTWGLGRFVHLSGTGNEATHSFYYGDNEIINFSMRSGASHRNSGEQYLSDFVHVLYRGVVAQSGSNTVTSTTMGTDYTGHCVLVVDGKGRGQVREITGNVGSTITVAPNWAVPPAQNTIIHIGPITYRHVIYNSTFDGRGGDAPWGQLEGSSGAQALSGPKFFGPSASIIIDNNLLTDLRSGVSYWSLRSGVLSGTGGSTLEPVFFNLNQNNTVSNTVFGLETVSFRNATPTLTDTTFLGNVTRNSSVDVTIEDPQYTADPTGVPINFRDIGSGHNPYDVLCIWENITTNNSVNPSNPEDFNWQQFINVTP